MVRAKLVVVGGDLDVPEIALAELPVTIGRSRENTIALAHPLVSRVHCRIFERNQKLTVRDNESLNGTFIGNQRIVEGVLDHEDLLTIGSVTFRAVYLGPNGAPIDETIRILDVNETVRIDRIIPNCHSPDDQAASPVTHSPEGTTSR